MARMLEALKRTPERPVDMEISLPAAMPEMPKEKLVDDDMPFVEVGGPRHAPQLSRGLEEAAARAVTLQIPTPFGVSLRPQAAVAPASAVASELIAYHHPNDAVSHQYAALYGQIVPGPAEASRVVVLTSLAAGAGTTTALLNMAVAGSGSQSKSLIVVDANWARPAVAGRLGLPGAKGLSEVVEGRIALEAAIQGTPIKNLHVLPAGNKDLISDPADALRWILSRLRDRFDAVLVDAPSWSDEADATFRTLAAAADAIYLVVHAGEVDQQKVRTLMRDLGRLGGHLGGLIVMR